MKNNTRRWAFGFLVRFVVLANGALCALSVADAQQPNAQKAPGVPKAVAPPASIVKPPSPAALIAVPPVIGMTAAEATERLGRFTVQARSVPSVRANGMVIDQSPPSPTLRPARSVVTIDVSDGSRVLVPSVSGRREADARARLTTNDLVARIEAREADQAPGIIVEQRPAAGTEVDRQSAVELSVSTGLGVPKVVGESLDEARRRLARFTVEFAIVESAELDRSVVTQEPAAGARVAAGTRVRLQVSDGSMVAVPDLQSGTLDAARTALRDAGLIAAVRGGPDVAVAVVKVQSPAARSLVKRGTQVDLETRAPIAWTATGLIALTLLVAAGIWQWRRTPRLVAPPEPQAELAHIVPPSVRATVQIAASDSRIDGAELAGPPARIAVRLEKEQSTVRTVSGEPQ